MIRIVALVFLVMPLVAHAAESPVARSSKSHPHHGRHSGYYFGHFGGRSGGTAGSWYGSTFALLDRSGGRVTLASGSKRAIHCPASRPLVCLAEPVVAPLGRR